MSLLKKMLHLLSGCPDFELVQATYLSKIKALYERTGRDRELLKLVFDESKEDYEKSEKNHESILHTATVFLGTVSILLAILVGFSKFVIETFPKTNETWHVISWLVYISTLFLFGSSLLLASRVFIRIPRYSASLLGRVENQGDFEEYLMVQILTVINATESNRNINIWKAFQIQYAIRIWRIGIFIVIVYGFILGIANLSNSIF